MPYNTIECSGSQTIFSVHTSLNIEKTPPTNTTKKKKTGLEGSESGFITHAHCIGTSSRFHCDRETIRIS